MPIPDMESSDDQDWLIQEDPNTLAAMKARGEEVNFASPLKAPPLSPGESLWAEEEAKESRLKRS
jgi:hypothetical protein